MRATILFLTIFVLSTVGIAQSNAPLASGQSSASQALPPMPGDAKPTFDVATITPSDTSSPRGSFFRINGRHVVAYNISVEDLITYAYSIQVSQVVDGLSSLMAKHFDIDGLPDVVGRPSRSQSRLMFQQLLVSRFRLAFHYESRELPVYAIQIAKGGPKLTQTARKLEDGTSFSYTCPPALTYRNYSISEFAKVMQEAFLDRPVVDQTGLKNRYDFDLKWTPDDSQRYCPPESADSHGDPNAPPGIYTAIQEQLGLKIVATKAPAQVMVIDHIETPSEN